MAAADPEYRGRDRREHPGTAGRGADAARPGPQAGVLGVLYHAQIQGDRRDAAQGLPAAQAAGLCAQGGAGQPKEPAGDRRRLRLFVPRGLYTGVQADLRRHAQRVPQKAGAARAAHQDPSVRPLLFWNGRDRYDAVEGGRKDLLRDHPRAQIPAHQKLREQRLLGLLAKAKPDPRPGLRHHLRPAGQHPGQAGRQRRQRHEQRRGPADGLHQRPGGPPMRLGHPPHRVLRRAEGPLPRTPCRAAKKPHRQREMPAGPENVFGFLRWACRGQARFFMLSRPCPRPGCPASWPARPRWLPGSPAAPRSGRTRW